MNCLEVLTMVQAFIRSHIWDQARPASHLFVTMLHSFVLQGEEMANRLAQPVPERTFQYQNVLPALPVPTLESSLSKYLDAGGMFAVSRLPWFRLLY